jgi:hypothetical protein
MSHVIEEWRIMESPDQMDVYSLGHTMTMGNIKGSV